VIKKIIQLAQAEVVYGICNTTILTLNKKLRDRVTHCVSTLVLFFMSNVSYQGFKQQK